MSKEEFIKKLQEEDFTEVYVKNVRGSLVEPNICIMPNPIPQEEANNILVIS